MCIDPVLDLLIKKYYTVFVCSVEEVQNADEPSPPKTEFTRQDAMDEQQLNTFIMKTFQLRILKNLIQGSHENVRGKNTKNKFINMPCMSLKRKKEWK